MIRIMMVDDHSLIRTGLRLLLKGEADLTVSAEAASAEEALEKLAREPADITIGSIITTMEGPIALVDCLLTGAGDKNQVCNRANHCVTRGVWEKVCDSISDVLEHITLEDLCRDGSQDGKRGRK